MKEDAFMDQLKQFALDSQPEKRRSWGLDLREYHAAIRAGSPIPRFSCLNADGSFRPQSRRYLDTQRVKHITNSPLSPSFYEEVHGVEEPIVRHLRRLHEEGRLPPRDDRLEVVLDRGKIKVVKKID